MKLVNILLDIGTASPSVLDSVVGRDSASALETVRRTACTGAKDVLSEAPPVLLHPSKLPAANFLYSAEKPSPVEDGPYQHIGRDEVCAIRDGACIGGAIMDVCKDHSLPVILFATIGESGMEITCEMYGAPLAAMEAELYSSARPPTAFERRWLGAEAHGAKTLRRQVGNYVRKRGYDQMPTWMHENAFAAVRYGVLPFLRLRHADTTQEVEALTALMEHEVTPKGNGGLPSPTSPLKVLVDDMWQHDTPLRMKTVFYAMAHSEKPPPPSVGDVERNCRDPMHNSLLWPLALLILQHLEDPDYYGVEEDLEPEEEGEEEEETDHKLQQIVDEMALKEEAFVKDNPVNEVSHAVYHSGDGILMRLTAATLRQCDSKMLMRGAGMAEALNAIVGRAFCESDAAIMRDAFGNHTAPFHRVAYHLGKLSRQMVQRYAFLIITKHDDGTIGDNRLVCHEGDWEPSNDSISRYLLFPWVLPIVVEANVVYELKVHNVHREQFRLTEAARLEATRSRVAEIPAEIKTFISQASEGLKSLPALASRLGSLEMQLKTAPPVAAAAPTTSTAEPAAPVVVEMSETQRGLKRLIAQLENYEASLEASSR